jgi:hypothetical protein
MMVMVMTVMLDARNDKCGNIIVFADIFIFLFCLSYLWFTCDC